MTQILQTALNLKDIDPRIGTLLQDGRVVFYISTTGHTDHRFVRLQDAQLYLETLDAAPSAPRYSYNVIVLKHVDAEVTINDMRAIDAYAVIDTDETAQALQARLEHEAYDRYGDTLGLSIYIQPYTLSSKVTA